jgi:ubiquinone/menaquinone biosynthesis C-methylase UbiE
MPGEETYLEKLRLADHLRTSTVRSAIQALGLPSGSRGLDAGCGAGSLTCLLAEEVGTVGHVTGVDVNSEFLAHAQKTAEDRGLAKRASFQQGDVSRLSFEANSFDWAWSVDCVGFIPASPVQLL